MGHIRLGVLPQTRNWRQVIEALGDAGAAPDEVARDTFIAAAPLLGISQATSRARATSRGR